VEGEQLAVSRTIEMVQGQIRGLESDLSEKKRMVNSLCSLIGRPAMYANTEPVGGSAVGIRADEFYSRPLATVVRSILEKRQAIGLGAASLDELYEAMVQGGFRFEAKNDGTAKRSLSVSLAKNNTTFHRVPNGHIGLLEWYPDAKKSSNGKKDDAKDEAAATPAAPSVDDTEYRNEFAEEAAKEKSVAATAPHNPAAKKVKVV
jgi:hypothetical protein